MLDNSRKQKILRASLEEFSEYGFEKASTDRISQKAEVSKGLIFHHFGSKENLFMITMNKCIDDVLTEFNNLDLSSEDFISIIMRIIEMKYDYYKKNPMQYKLMINGFYNTPKKLKKELEQRYLELRRIGVNFIVDIVKKLHIKKDVSIENAVSVIGAVTNIVENKYLSYLADENTSFEEFCDIVNSEYIKLMNIVLYGIIDSQE